MLDLNEHIAEADQARKYIARIDSLLKDAGRQ
jgi:hypothetical protein